MNHPDKVKLLAGPYRPPTVRPGGRAVCLIGGEVRCCGTSSAPIPWPWAKKGRGGRPTPIVNKELARAISTESEAAVAYWWGVSEWTVWQWRKALGVPAVNPGTHRLKSLNAQTPAVVAGRAKAHAKNQDLKRRRKISEAKKGKPRPASVVEAVRRANKARKVTAETKAKMSATHRKRGTWPPAAGRAWTREEDELVETLPAADVARTTGRSLIAVYVRRSDLKVPDGRRK